MYIIFIIQHFYVVVSNDRIIHKPVSKANCNWILEYQPLFYIWHLKYLRVGKTRSAEESIAMHVLDGGGLWNLSCAHKVCNLLVGVLSGRVFILVHLTPNHSLNAIV